MSKKDKEVKLEHYKVFFKKIIVPNMKEWFKFHTTSYQYSTYRDKLDPQDVHYAYIDYTSVSTDYQGKKQTHSERLYLIDTEMPVRTYYYIGRHLSELTKFKGSSHVISGRNIQSFNEWNISVLEVLIQEAEKLPQYQVLKDSINLDEILSKEKNKRNKQKEHAEKKRAVKFTYTDQKAIAQVLFNLVIQKTGNYLLKMTDDRIPATDTDISGESLAAAMDIYNIDKADIINALVNSPNTVARRFAALFAENNVAALIDQDKTVRLAAKARQVKRKEEQTNGDASVDQ